MLCFDVYYTMVIVCCQVFVTFFLKVFLRKFFVVLSCLIHPWVGAVACARVFASAPPSFACAGFYMMVGVLVWGWVRKGVGGAARGVG